MSNKEFLQKRLAEYTATMERHREAGDYAMFIKWEQEVNNIKRMIELNNALD